MRIAHLSDVHFGRLAHPQITRILVDEVNAAKLDLVIISGDLTQRARRSQFKPAKKMIESFNMPVVVIPGNHDVVTWYWPLERMFRSWNRYKKHIASNENDQFESDKVSVLGLNTSHGFTIKSGIIKPEHPKMIKDFFADKPINQFKILAVHQPLAQLKSIPEGLDKIPNGELALKEAASAGVDLLLWGHLHLSRVEEINYNGHRMIVAAAGTATSNRYRQDHDNKINIYNWITVNEADIEIEERAFDRNELVYKILRKHQLERNLQNN